MNETRINQFSIIIFVVFSVLITGCPTTSITSKVKGPDDTVVIEANSELFILDEGTGIISFTTNDVKYSGEHGYTLWTEESAVQDPFVHLNVSLNKTSGNEAAGYGVVFGSHDSTMLVVLINTYQEFIIGELTGNLFTELQSWEKDKSLKSGYNKSNIIDISYNSGTGNFSLSFNGGEINSFRDDDEPFHLSGKNGYMIVISPLDNFPEMPVSITFKKN
ncbi:MAG: hypothetical protein J7L71_09875 [Spirochaetaceae bacterium]|nr:hypothetical protein [Spirochaetaceae bacterium]